jgi:circadian clock protein KaiB
MNHDAKGQAGIPAKLEKAVEQSRQDKYVLRLVIAGTSRRSNKAVANLKEICDRYLPGRYELEIIDIYQQPELAQGLQVIGAPTLLKRLPPPLRRLVGDLSQKERILLALGLPPNDKEEPAR